MGHHRCDVPMLLASTLRSADSLRAMLRLVLKMRLVGAIVAIAVIVHVFKNSAYLATREAAEGDAGI